MKCLLNVNNMQKVTTIVILIFSLFSYSQKATIKGLIKDQQNRSIQSASVSLFDEKADFLGYAFTNENGLYSISFDKPKNETIKIEISCLGYHKISKLITTENLAQNFKKKKKTEPKIKYLF